MTAAAETPAPHGLVVLFYSYVNIPDPAGAIAIQKSLCEQLGLRGRLRIGAEGINGTLGGTASAVRKYMAATDADAVLGAIPIEWKLSAARGVDGAEHFDSLQCRVVHEICSLGGAVGGKNWDVKRGGTHLSPTQWHELLQTGRLTENDADTSAENKSHDVASSNAKGEGVKIRSGADEEGRAKSLCVIDCRNVYEWQIGRFELGDEARQRCGAEILFPMTRNFAQFPAWVDSHLESLRGKRVAMYCTGGVRCETASALLRSRGVEDVFQLRGGIHQYAKQFPLTRVRARDATAVADAHVVSGAEAATDEPSRKRRRRGDARGDESEAGGEAAWQHGLFRGENFVFDERQTASPLPSSGFRGTAVSSLSPTAPTTIGRCSVCGILHSRYDRSRSRCVVCRMLVLVCDDCCAASQHNASDVTASLDSGLACVPLYCRVHSSWRSVYVEAEKAGPCACDAAKTLARLVQTAAGMRQELQRGSRAGRGQRSLRKTMRKKLEHAEAEIERMERALARSGTSPL